MRNVHAPRPCNCNSSNNTMDASYTFYHGLGDISNHCHSIPLYLKRGCNLEVACTPEKAMLFQAAGAKIVEKARDVHAWLHAPRPGEPTPVDHWSGNKSAFNISHRPMPNIGSYADLWQEYLNVTIDLSPYCSKENEKFVSDYIDKLPRPLVVAHFQGNTGQAEKNLSPKQQEETLRGLIDRTEGSVISLDWDDRVLKLNHYRVRHLTDDWQKLNLSQLYWLLRKCDLAICCDSGVLHFSRFARCPTIGVWTKHSPSHYVLPRPDLLNLVPPEQNELTRYRRLAYNIVEGTDGAFIADQAVKMLGERKLLAQPGQDVCLQGLLAKLRGVSSPWTSFVDRHLTMTRFLSYARKVSNPLILETGCMRDVEDFGAGMSTLMFGYFLSVHGGELQSVDLSGHNVNFARTWCQGLPVTVHQLHSHAFLQSFNKQIDLLYLDSADVGTDRYQECCLIEVHLALPRLAENAVILIDDTVWSKGQWTGKGAKAVPWLLDHGWKVALAGYQVLLTKENV